jgi:hypothetical protein
MDSLGLAGDLGLMGDDSVDDLLGDFDLGLDSLASDNTADIAGATEPTSVPGLFGNQYELQVDVSHLPRVDQYERVFLATPDSPVADIPSDVKTVAYFLREDVSGEMTPSTGGLVSTPPPATGSGGLIRREMDRAVTAWAAQSGDLDTESGDGQLLAPEVNYLEFRYFDGWQWQTEWDSEELGGLPVAVEITIGIDPGFGLDSAATDVAALRELSMADMSEFMYRLVVRLPTAQPLPLEEETLDSEGLEAVGI